VTTSESSLLYVFCFYSFFGCFNGRVNWIFANGSGSLCNLPRLHPSQEKALNGLFEQIKPCTSKALRGPGIRSGHQRLCLSRFINSSTSLSTYSNVIVILVALVLIVFEVITIRPFLCPRIITTIYGLIVRCFKGILFWQCFFYFYLLCIYLNSCTNNEIHFLDSQL
jgi:hypothetical protein